uniref:Secreted protein n=1 Tax=Arundo donax TaxID=35708 RepID=A0A0A8YIC0_ARUDO
MVCFLFIFSSCNMLAGVQVGLVSRKPRAEQVLMSKSIIYYSRGAGGPEWLPKPVPTPATRVLAPVLAYREVPPLTFLLKKIIYYSKIYGYCSSP